MNYVFFLRAFMSNRISWETLNELWMNSIHERSFWLEAELAPVRTRTHALTLRQSGALQLQMNGDINM